jgi:hypothetical protein
MKMTVSMDVPDSLKTGNFIIHKLLTGSTMYFSFNQGYHFKSHIPLKVAESDTLLTI